MFSRASLSHHLLLVRRSIPVLPFTTGVCAAQIIGWFLSATLVIGSAVALGVVWMVANPKRGGGILGFVVGLTIVGWEITLHPSPLTASDVQILLRVEDIPRHRVPGEVVFVGSEVLGGEGRLIRCRAVDLPWRQLSRVAHGDVVWVRGAVRPVSRQLNPFSWEGWLWRRGISGEMKVLFASKALMRHPAPLDVVRLRIIDAVSNATGESRGGALFLSMAFGVRDVLSPPVEALFTNLGLSHLLVVSGYQVSLVFGGVLSLLLGVGRTLRASLGMRTVGIVASLMCASVYVIAIGSEMSSVRALVAAICLCISLLMNRRHGFAQRLVATFLCMHIVWPWALCEIGVVLTFAALSGIGIGSVLGAGGRLRSLVWVTVSVWGMTSVVTVVWNGALSVSGLFLNLLLAAPWSILNCTVGVGALALELAGVPGAAIALRGVGSANEVIVAVLFWLQGIIGSSREAALVERGVTALALVGTCWGMAAAAVRLAQAESMRSMVRGTPGPRQQR